jgi:hypothetical protein
MNARQTELAVARLVRELPAELTRMGYSPQDVHPAHPLRR